MRDSSYNSSTQTKQIFSRGGEKKVMKKSLSLILALALVFGLFANMAAAADAPAAPTTAEKYKALVDAGLLKGTTDGDPHIANNLTRAEFATIAAAVAGLPAVTAGQTFSDVKAGQWYFGAIEAAARAGLVNGTGLGKFTPKANVTVEQIVKVAVLLAGLKPTADTAVAGASGWAAGYIKAAIAAGLISEQASYTGAATRGQAIDIAYSVVTIKSVPTLKDVKATLGTDDTAAVTGTVVGKADSVKVAVDAVAEVSATLKDDKTFTYTTAKLAAGEHTIKVTAYDGAKKSAVTELKVTVEKFTVTGATVLNGKQIKVQFNKAVQEGVASGGHNYQVSAVVDYYRLKLNSVETAPTRVALSDDKTAVTLTFGPTGYASLKDTYAQLTVKTGLKSASGIALTEYKQPIFLADGVAPTATVVYEAPVIKVKFSEPIDVLGSVSVDGVTYTTYTTTTDAEGDVTELQITASEGNHRVDLISYKDIFGNTLTDFNATVTVVKDSTAPTVASISSENSKIRVKFSENLMTDAGRRFGLSINGVVYSVTATEKTNDSDAEYLYDASAIVPSGTSFVNYSVKVVAGYKDLSGNAGSESSASTLLLKKDVDAPALDGAVVLKDRIIYVKYNEAVIINTAPGAVTVKFTSTDNVVLTESATVVTSVGYDSDNDGNTTDSGENQYLALQVDTSEANLLSGGKFKAGKFVVTIPASTVRDSAGNIQASAKDASFTAGTSDTTGESIDFTVVASGGTLTFTFDEELTNDALNVNNYTINGTALPAATNLYFSGTKFVVKAELPSGTIFASGFRTVAVKNIVGKDGNRLTQASKDGYPLNLLENVKPAVASGTIVSATQLKVAFSEQIVVSTVTGVEVWINGSKSDATFTFSADGSDNKGLIITAPANTFALDKTIVVKLVGAAGIVDVNSNGAADGEVTAK
ncbi:S-layer homology domain-containing protein [Cohnella suwonensis]|uniref:S-layer homology domain-containing protein n=1 Tax=Cohnella suwonensis TaxID=696072 RepID=A0ABW0LYF8_9BACL